MLSNTELRKTFANEQVLIILLCRLYFKTASKNEVADFIAGNAIDPVKFLRLAKLHRIRPLIYHVLTTHCLDLDAGAISSLKDYFLQNQLHSFEKLHILKQLTSSLEEKHIHTIPLKGVLFSAQYFDNTSLRENSDIDLIASVKDIEAIEELLIQAGYKQKMSVPSGYLLYYKKHFKEIVYIVPSKYRSKGYTLEVHWRLINKYMGQYISYDFLKSGVTAFSISNTNFVKLNPSYDLIATISNHFVKDLSVKFKYLVDVAAIISKAGNEIDNSLIEKIKSEYHCAKKIELGFFLTSELLGVELKAYPPAREFNTRHIKEVLSMPLSITKYQASNPAFIRRSLELQDNFSQKLRFLARCATYLALPTNNDINQFRLKPSLLPSLFLLRPIRVIGKLFGIKRK